MNRIICFICNSDENVYSKNILTIKSKHSAAPLIELMEKCFKHHYLDRIQLKYSFVCKYCVTKFEEYDLAITTALRIEEEFRTLLMHKKEVEQPTLEQAEYLDLEDNYNLVLEEPAITEPKNCNKEKLTNSTIDSPCRSTDFEQVDEYKTVTAGIHTTATDESHLDTDDSIETETIFHNYSNEMIMKLENNSPTKHNRSLSKKKEYKCEYCFSDFTTKYALTVSIIPTIFIFIYLVP